MTWGKTCGDWGIFSAVDYDSMLKVLEDVVFWEGRGNLLKMTYIAYVQSAQHCSQFMFVICDGG